MEFPNYREYSYEDYAFEFTDKKWRKYLDDNGFVVIKSVVKDEDCLKYRGELWKTIKSLTDVELRGENKKYAKNYPFSLHSGMYNIGHTKTQWEIREKVKFIYEELWDDKDLITSFDKFAYLPRARTYQNKPISSWIHIDQCLFNKDIVSYQGLLCLSNNMEYKSGGNVCIPTSHLLFEKIMGEEDVKGNKNDWIKLSDEFKEKYVKEENVLKTKTKRGDFVIWNSKMVHANMTPRNVKTENDMEKRYERVCVYVCMRKRSEINKRTANRRLKAFNEKRSTTHNPAKFKLFNKNLGRWSDITYDDIQERLNKNDLMFNGQSGLV